LTATPAHGAGGRARRAAGFAAWVGGGTLVVWIVCAVALWIYAGPAHGSETRELLIPRGTAQLVRQGENPLNIPAKWGFHTGDVLLVENRDAVAHVIGPWKVAPGTTQEIVLRSTQSSFFGCSVHPSGRLIIDVEPLRTDWPLTVAPTLAFGPALGLGAYVLRRVSHRLGDDDGLPTSTPGQVALFT
jgi:hypothetical protein